VTATSPTRRDGNFAYKNRYPTPAGLDALKTLCRAELAKLGAKDDKPITIGKVDLTEAVPVVTPPTQDELDRAAFVARVELARKLAVIVSADDKDLADRRGQIASDLKAHPEWKKSL